MTFYIVMTIFFLGLYLFVGLYSSKNLKTLDDFYVMGRNAPAYLITGTLVATNISSVAMVGYVGSVFTLRPLPYVLFFGATVICSLFLGLYMGRYLWRMKLWTVPDFFVKRYPSEGIKIISTIIVLVSMTLYLVSVLMGSNVILIDIFHWSPTASLIVTIGIITIFTMAGGMKGVVVTDTLMFIVFFVAAMLLAPYIINAAGGWPTAFSTASNELPNFTKLAGNYDPIKNGYWFIIESNIMSMILVMASPQLLSRVNIAKSEKTLGRSMILLGLVVPIFVFGLIYVFGLLPLIAPDINPTNAMPYTAINLVPKFIGALALSGVVAAAMSSASSLFQQGAAALSRDIYERYINKNASEERKLMVSRLAVLLLAIFVFVLAKIPTLKAATIVYAFLFATAVWAAWFPALVFGVFWKKASKQAALWSMSLGFVATMIVGFGRTFKFTPSWLPPNLTGLVVATIVFLIAANIYKTSSAELEVYEEMRKPYSEA